jgi:ElaB/YqjD/DUF883 family membrane-anchored ribosome-binding protein
MSLIWQMEKVGSHYPGGHMTMANRNYGDRPVDPLIPPAAEPLDTQTRPTTTWRDQGESAQSSQGGSKTDTAKQQAQHAKEKAGDMAGQAHDKADAGMDRAAEGLGRAAETLREQGDSREGKVGNVATSAASALEQGAEKLRTSDTDQLMNELEAMVRRKPIESMLVAAGVGFILSKALR